MTRMIESFEGIERNDLVLETLKSNKDTSHSSKTAKGVLLKSALRLAKSKIRGIIVRNIVMSMGISQLIVQ
jgi:hypothetical protein